MSYKTEQQTFIIYLQESRSNIILSIVYFRTRESLIWFAPLRWYLLFLIISQKILFIQYLFRATVCMTRRDDVERTFLESNRKWQFREGSKKLANSIDIENSWTLIFETFPIRNHLGRPFLHIDISEIIISIYFILMSYS